MKNGTGILGKSRILQQMIRGEADGGRNGLDKSHKVHTQWFCWPYPIGKDKTLVGFALCIQNRSDSFHPVGGLSLASKYPPYNEKWDQNFSQIPYRSNNTRRCLLHKLHRAEKWYHTNLIDPIIGLFLKPSRHMLASLSSSPLAFLQI